MTNLPKEWQERAERYSEHNSDYNDGYHKGASEMQQAILKVIEEELNICRLSSRYSNNQDETDYYIAKGASIETILHEIQNVKPKK